MVKLLGHSIYLFCLVVFLGACNVTQKIKDGDTAFERKQYAVAIDFLREEFESARSESIKAYKANLLAQSYERVNKPQEAIAWYRTAYQNGAGPDALAKYAKVLKEDQQYANAIKAYQLLIDSYGKSPEWISSLKACEQAREWISNQNNNPYRITRADFNTASAEYAPVYYEDGSIIFTSDRELSTGQETYKWTGRNFSDFFQTYPGKSIAEPFDDRFNTRHNEGTMAFTPNYQEVYFSRCENEEGGDDFCKILYSRREGRLWTVPQPLPFLKPGVNYGHPAIFMGGDALIFAANDPEGIGGYDLYMVYKRGGEWLEPFLLPESINTEGNEMFPTSHRDTLYFSSDQSAGMGGLDIYKTYMSSPDIWEIPENLQAPVNSGGDDFGFAVDPFFQANTQTRFRGVFTSSREDGAGNDDIYYFAKRVLEPRDSAAADKEREEYQVKVVGTVYEQLYADNSDPGSPKMGLKPITNNVVRIESNGLFDFVQTDEEGQYEYVLQTGRNYTFSSSRDSLLATSGRVSTIDLDESLTEDVTYILDLTLDRIFYNKEVVLENIYYDFNKWDIREDAEPTLDELTELLQDNPEIRIELGSHTDCRGTDAYNIGLSQRRAQSVVDYLIEKGIDGDRLRAVGYGETRLINTCPCEECTEEEHQENRRTTFKIVQ